MESEARKEHNASSVEGLNSIYSYQLNSSIVLPWRYYFFTVNGAFRVKMVISSIPIYTHTYMYIHMENSIRKNNKVLKEIAYITSARAKERVTNLLFFFIFKVCP